MIDMAKCLKRNACTSNVEDKSNDDNQKDGKEKFSVEKLIKLATKLLAGLEQQSFVSEQEIMNVYLLQDKLIKE